MAENEGVTVATGVTERDEFIIQFGREVGFVQLNDHACAWLIERLAEHLRKRLVAPPQQFNDNGEEDGPEDDPADEGNVNGRRADVPGNGHYH